MDQVPALPLGKLEGAKCQPCGTTPTSCYPTLGWAVSLPWGSANLGPSILPSKQLAGYIQFSFIPTAAAVAVEADGFCSSGSVLGAFAIFRLILPTELEAPRSGFPGEGDQDGKEIGAWAPAAAGGRQEE